MPTFKKLVFAFPFLLALLGVYQSLNPILQDIYLIFDFQIETLSQLLTFMILLTLASLFFIIFATLAQDWKFILPVALLGSLPALFFLSFPSSLVVALGFLTSFMIILLALDKKLSTYLTFTPTSLLLPSITQLSMLLLAVVSVALFIAADTKIKEEGFELPDSFVDQILQVSMPKELSEQGPKQSQPQIPPEQLELLRQNPQLLKQYGLDPSILDEINTQSAPPAGGRQTPSVEQSLVKNEVKKQIDNIVKPYLDFLPIALAAIFFLTLKFGLSVLSLTLFPLVWLIFWVLEKTGFTKFETEMREVKKLVI